MSDIVYDRMLLDYLAQKNDQSNRIAALEEEIARLRLTDAEREAVAVAMHRCDGPEFQTLRSLLERTK